MSDQEIPKSRVGPAPQTPAAAPRPAPALWFILGQVLLGLALLLALGYYFRPSSNRLVTGMANRRQLFLGPAHPLRHRVYCLSEMAGTAATLAPLLVGPGGPGPGVRDLFPGGRAHHRIYFPALALVVILAGVLWLLGGWRLVRLLSFPLLLLAMVIPLPQMVLSRLTLRMQLASSQLAADMLRLMGYPVALYGNVIDLGDRQLQVVAACSGLGYLFNALGLGVIFCYFFQRRAWKVAVLLLSMIPFAIIANASRLATIGIWPIFEKGLWHASFGLSIFIVGFDYLKGINWILNYFSPATLSSRNEGKGKRRGRIAAAHRSRSAPLAASPRFSFYPYLAAGLALVLLIAPWAVKGVEAVPVPLKQSFDHFPCSWAPGRGGTSILIRK